MLAQIHEQFPQDVRIVIRDFPLTEIHDKAKLASQAAQAARLQGKIQEMHDLLFDDTNWQAWTAMSVTDFEKWLGENASKIDGLDVARFKTDLNSAAVVKLVEDSRKGGDGIGVTGTPFLLLNGLGGAPADYETLSSLVKLFLLPEKAPGACPEMVIDPARQYTATITTTRGDVVIKLFADKAPTTVNSFVYLARQGWFDGALFHRVIPGFVAQTGDPSGSGFGGPGYEFGVEITDLRFNKAGMVGMARSQDPNTNGSQFFITYDAVPSLDGQYTVFGEVISGMEFVNQLTPRDPSNTNQVLLPGDKIVSVTIEEK